MNGAADTQAFTSRETCHAPNHTGNGTLGDHEQTQAMPQPIAIIGYACRLPGQVASPSDLWELCTRKRSGWSPMPKDRFSFEAFHHPNPSKVGAFNPAGGYFLEDDIAHFDAPFFNVSAQEAVSMDPQQRLLLECSYEALESAGIPKESLAGRNVGVFVGGNFADYEFNNLRDVETIPMYQATGCAPSLQSNRISYTFDLRGPSFTVDTACSSSLVALHYAVQSLRSGESSEAIVAGCRLNFLPDYFVAMSMSQLFNDAGKTFSFDERATSGFARGEGAGVVILKSLDAALRDHDPIRAVILNSGVSQDGKTQGITQPNGLAQEDLIRRVYRDANLRPEECGFVEMHGTGTKVGDPIEAAATHEALGQGRASRDPLYIGSVKSNVGHLEGASGVVSLIKAAMILDHGLLLPNADFRKANENIPLNKWNMKVVTSTRPWPRGKKYLSVSNYGFGGTNAHVVLQKAPLVAKLLIDMSDGADALSDPKRRLFVISANTKESLESRIRDFGIYFEQRPEVFEEMHFANFAYTLGNRMSNLSYRVAVSATSLDDLGIRLAQMKVNPSRTIGAPKIGFVFTGQGAQWAQMGVPLINEYPLFAAVMKRADECLWSLGASFSLIDELQKDVSSSEINSPHISQPACTALQIGLVVLLQSWGICPSSVMGHSSGEISAAFAAGVYDLESAMTLAYRRGQMTQLLKESYPLLKGTMLAVGVGPESIRPMLKMLQDGYATVACINSPSSVTVSGDVSAIIELEKALQDKQLFHRRLKIDVAYHSDHMKNVSEAYLSSIASIKPAQSPTAVLYSSVFGRLAKSSELGPSYWVQNLTSPVLFPNAISEMCNNEGRLNLLIEIGPHSALKGPIMDTLKHLDPAASKIAYVPTLVRNADAAQSLLDTAAAAYVRGATLEMTALNFPCTGARSCEFLTDLPRYPWQHATRYWHEPRIAQKHRTRDGVRNDVLGLLANYSNDLEPTWRNIVRLDDVPWLRDHKMQGMTVYPLAGYLTMVCEAAQKRAEHHGVAFSKFELREVIIGSALILSDDSDTETTISLRPYAEGTRGSSDVWDEFRIWSWSSKRGWTEHCSGLVGVRAAPGDNATVISSQVVNESKHVQDQITKIDNTSTQRIDTQHLYRVLTDLGADYGPTFRGVENCFADPHHSRADIYVRNTKLVMPKEFEPKLTVHPAFLDAFIHVVWPILGQGCMELNTLYMPTMIKHATISRNIPFASGEHVKAYCTGSPSLPVPEPTRFDLFATQHNSTELLIAFEGFVMTPIRDSSAGRNGEVRKLCYKFQWQPLCTGGITINGQPTTNKDNIIDSHDISNGHDTTNGVDVTNGHTNTNSHVLPIDTKKQNGKPNGVHILHQRDILIAQFDELDDVAEQLADAISLTNTSRPSIGRLEEIDCTGKNVVVIQPITSSLRNLTQALFEAIKKTLLNAANVLWVYRTEAPDAQMTVGLARSIRSETLAKVATLGLDPQGLREPARPIMATMDALWPIDGAIPCEDFEFKTEGSQLLIPRVWNDDSANSFVHNETRDLAISFQPFTQLGRRFKIQIGNPGALDTLYFADDEPGLPGDDEVEIEVRATGVNFKDIVVSMGQLAQPYIGIECSGIISSVGKNVRDLQVGQRVMAMPEGSYSTYARCLSTSVVPIPENMTFGEASTVPVVFCTAYYGLFDLGHLVAGERVLIHAGAGGVGQAAIMLAQMTGADVFVTVGSLEKKRFLMTQYAIPEGRIFYSRDTSFGSAIRRATNHDGVDVVLNSLAGDLLRETWECLAPFGRFVEIGKADITKNSRLDMSKFEYNVTFSSVDLTKVAKYRPTLMKRLLDDVCRLISDGSAKPISPITTYRMSETEVAFRTLQTGKNIGKVVVIPHPEDQVKAVMPKVSSNLLQPDASYILIGGTGGLGRSMAKWMSSKGARNIVLVSRKAVISDQVEALIAELALKGTRIFVKTCDVRSRQSVENLVKGKMKGLPPVRGVVHGAMVLRDILFENMTLDDFQAVISCKVEGAWNLHHALIDSPLDFFIALSSVAGVVGNRGQAAYAAANVFLDGFMEYRRSRNLPGTSIDLTAVSDVGYLAESDSKRREDILKNLNGQTIDESEVLALLAAAITGDLDKSCSGQCITGLGLTDPADNFWAQDTKFTFLREAVEAQTGPLQEDGATVPLRQALKIASSKEVALRVCFDALITKLAEVLVISIDDMDPTVTISSLGLDSLVAIEIRNWIAREVDANVQVLELLSSGSLIALAEIVLNKSKLSLQYES